MFIERHSNRASRSKRALRIIATAFTGIVQIVASTKAAEFTSEEGPSIYVVRVVSVDAPHRDKFIECVKNTERPFWQKLRETNKIITSKVFESDKVIEELPNIPYWNFLMLTHIGNHVLPQRILELLLDHPNERGQCELLNGVALKRLEVMHTTPNSNYAREAVVTAELAKTARAVYNIEYIAIREGEGNSERYRQAMRESVGPAEAFMIRDGWDLSFVALETTSVSYIAPGMPTWDTIHIGLYTAKSLTAQGDAALDAALRRVNPNNGGVQGVFGAVSAYRTKPRVDSAHQVYELEVH